MGELFATINDAPDGVNMQLDEAQMILEESERKVSST